MSIEVICPGLFTSVQDLGRHGYQRYGVTPGGAMDALSLRLANLLAGNAADAAGLEITLVGPVLRTGRDLLVALGGADLSPRGDGQPVLAGRPVLLRAGTTLEFGACRRGCRTYLAVAGGIDVPVVLGSRSTDSRAGFGGLAGRALREGDRLSVGSPGEWSARWMARLAGRDRGASFAATRWSAGPSIYERGAVEQCVRVVRGPEHERFDPPSWEEFLAGEFTVTAAADRMGYRLAGPPLRLAAPCELVSEAVATGTIQVPPDGRPIILMADRPTTGGYPRIAHVAGVDWPQVAQKKPGDPIRFREISLLEAQRLYLAREAAIETFQRGVQHADD